MKDENRMKNAEPSQASQAASPRAEALHPSSFILHPSSETPAPIHDCWNVIGVEGNGTCRELVKFIHCRNCPVYSAAGTQLLDRPLPAEYRREQAEHYAQPKKFS